MKRPLIAITGFRGCGKNYLYDKAFKYAKLQERSLFPKEIVFKNFAFADTLKKYCEKIFGFDLDEIERLKRENDVVFKVGKKSLNMRQILITVANSLRDLTDDAIWAKLTLETIKKYIKENENNETIIIPVITDLRFLSEYKLLKDNFNLFLIYTENNCEECLKNKDNSDEKEILKIKNFAQDSVALVCSKQDSGIENFENDKIFKDLKEKINKFIERTYNG
jgi:hypothetical protein